VGGEEPEIGFKAQGRGRGIVLGGLQCWGYAAGEGTPLGAGDPWVRGGGPASRDTDQSPACSGQGLHGRRTRCGEGAAVAGPQPGPVLSPGLPLRLAAPRALAKRPGAALPHGSSWRFSFL